ncbi:BICD family-like cargo adapter 1 [Plecturocebus cupreus]
MSAFCLGLAGRASAPAEPDSACCMELPAAAGDAVRSPAAAALISFPGGSGELELALEEELALLAAGERPSDPGEHPQAETGPLAEGAGPQPPPAQDPELLSVIRQKEKDLVLAARLGKALLERNQDMSRQYEQMHKELTDKLESNDIKVNSGEKRKPTRSPSFPHAGVEWHDHGLLQPQVTLPLSLLSSWDHSLILHT